MAEISAFLIASTWSLITLRATNSLREQLVNLNFPKTRRTATTSFCPRIPITAWCCSSLSTYLLENCAKQSSSMLSIGQHKLRGGYDCIPSHNWCYFFMQMTIVSVAVSASRHKHSYLPDTSVMCRWHDDDRIIDVQPKVICFCWEKQVSVALTMSTDHLFCSSPPLSPGRPDTPSFMSPRDWAPHPNPCFH